MCTINDVAKSAGVAVATVSRVINNKGYISKAMREKVYKTMDELNYYPNELSKSLIRGKTNIIGLLISDVSDLYLPELTKSIEKHAFENGYKLILCNTSRDLAKEKKYIEVLKSIHVDGIIVEDENEKVKEYVNLKFPVITIKNKITWFGDAFNVKYESKENYNCIFSNLNYNKAANILDIEKIGKIVVNDLIEQINNKAV